MKKVPNKRQVQGERYLAQQEPRLEVTHCGKPPKYLRNSYENIDFLTLETR